MCGLAKWGAHCVWRGGEETAGGEQVSSDLNNMPSPRREPKCHVLLLTGPVLLLTGPTEGLSEERSCA